MRVAFIYDAVFPYVVGGAEQRNSELAQVLCADSQVSLYSFTYWAADPGRLLPGCRYVGIGEPTPLYDSRGKRRIAEALVFAARLFFPLLRGEEDVWDISNFPYFSVPVARLANFFKKNKLVVTWHEYWGDYWYAYLGWRGIFGRLIESLALRCSPSIIAVSRCTAERLAAAGYPRQRIRVIPNGIDWPLIQRITPTVQTSDLIYAGRLVPHKRVDVLLHALRLLNQEGQHVTLRIVGDGPERGRLECLTAELGLSECVAFVGRVPSAEDVFAHFKSSRILLLASEREGFGMTVVQGWGCGIPAVVCRHPHSAAAELIGEPSQGRVVDGDAPAIAAACWELLNEPPGEFRAKRIEAARDYDWSRIALLLQAEYQRLSGEDSR